MLPPPPRVWGALSLSEAKRGDTLACPQCGDAMKPTVIHEVELDHCPKHGVWFDSDELRITLYRVADPSNPPPFKEWEPAPFLPAPPPPMPAMPPPVKGPPMNQRDLGSPLLVFEITEPGGATREVSVQSEVIKIGTMQKAQLRLGNDSSVSRMHAVIEAKPDELNVIDLGSNAGTFVNGERKNKARLAIGDTIRIGDTMLRLANIVVDKGVDKSKFF